MYRLYLAIYLSSIAICSNEEEIVSHIFFNCPFARDIWAWFFQWLHVYTATHQVPIKNFLQNSSLIGSGKDSRMADTLWIGVVWTLWNVRNDRIFNDIIPEATKIWEEIKARMWSWLSVKYCKVRDTPFTVWAKNPRGMVESRN